MNTIKTVGRFIKGIFGSMKDKYHLSFVCDDGIWYIDMPWDGNRINLSMVGGSDTMLDYLNDGSSRVNLEVIPSDEELDLKDYIELRQTEWSLVGGSYYKVYNYDEYDGQAYLCPVTLTVFGCYPKHIYIKPE